MICPHLKQFPPSGQFSANWNDFASHHVSHGTIKPNQIHWPWRQLRHVCFETVEDSSAQELGSHQCCDLHTYTADGSLPARRGSCRRQDLDTAITSGFRRACPARCTQTWFGTALSPTHFRRWARSAVNGLTSMTGATDCPSMSPKEASPCASAEAPSIYGRGACWEGINSRSVLIRVPAGQVMP
jgi:hypothetical protein